MRTIQESLGRKSPPGVRTFRALRTVACTGLLVVFAASGAMAQSGLGRPTVSPYLNLANRRSGINGLDYFTQVRPQQQFRAFGERVDRDLQVLQSQYSEPVLFDEAGQAPISATGHPTSFQNTSRYFGGGGGSSFGGSSLGASSSGARRSGRGSSAAQTARTAGRVNAGVGGATSRASTGVRR